MIKAHPAGEAELYDFLHDHGIGFRHHTHPPLHTVEESRALRGDLPGAHVKNMFMKDKKGAIWLATCIEDREIRIRDLEREIGAKNLSFGKADLLWECLGVKPGAVTPFGLLNDRKARVNFAIDAQLLNFETINAHPLHNEATTAISRDDLMRFVALTGHDAVVVDFDRLEAMARERAGGSGGEVAE